MLKNFRPPYHRADQPGQFIVPDDDARDKERIAAELAEMEAARRAAVEGAPAAYATSHGLELDELTPAQRDEAIEAAAAGLRREDHPLEVYWRGESRYDLQAQGHLMGKPVDVRDYFNKGTPTIFTLRRLGWQEYNRLLEIEDARSRLFSFARAGVTAICGPGVDLVVKGDDGIPNAWMQALFDADHHWGITVGTAVVLYNRALTESEKKGAPPVRVEV